MPACPFAFDVVNGAVLVPTQITACVFKAADCQTSPSGLWGPDGASLVADAAAIGKRRNEAENAMARALHRLEERAKDNPDAAASCASRAAFPASATTPAATTPRKPTHGFCAASVTEARAALLEARLAALSKADKEREGRQERKRKKAKPAADAGADKTQ